MIRWKGENSDVKCVFFEKIRIRQMEIFLKIFCSVAIQTVVFFFLTSSHFTVFLSCLLNASVICFAVTVGEAGGINISQIPQATS